MTCFEWQDAGQRWVVSWHSPALPPPRGKRHGSSALCLTSQRHVVLVSAGGVDWGFPGGRPEGDETWRDTLERELLEEACARVDEASLLGFSRGTCIEGHEEGLVLVRALWRATVTLLPWSPQHEITHRRLVRWSEVLDEISLPFGARPLYERWLDEAAVG